MPTATPKIPLWLKLLLTAFTAVLVPVYWREYGPTNFLYFCDIALLLVIAAVWWESSLLASMPAVGIVLIQLLWAVDFFAEAVGLSLTGVTGYMFSPSIPLFARALSSFHLWLPFLLLWMVARLGYDRRAFLYWTILAWVVILVSFLLMPPPPAPVDRPNLPVNINYVFGLSDKAPQTWMPSWAYLAVLMIGLPVLIYWPTHWVLQRLWGNVERRSSHSAGTETAQPRDG